MVSARGPNLAFTDQREQAPKTPLPLRPLIDYPVELRGATHLPGTRRVWVRHGQ